MILGLDFDNTIACYDGLFHELALERGLLHADTPRDKTAVRDALRQQGHENDWTEMQGLAYGPRIADATPFTHAVETIAHLVAQHIELHIVSHKTRTPYRGEPHDLHAAARHFLQHHAISPALIPAHRVHLCLTKDDKLDTIDELGCTHFLDDLPEFLAEPHFPGDTVRLLFDPKDQHPDTPGVVRLHAWQALLSHVSPDHAR